MDEFDAFVSSVTAQLRSQLRGAAAGEGAWASAQARCVGESDAPRSAGVRCTRDCCAFELRATAAHAAAPRRTPGARGGVSRICQRRAADADTRLAAQAFFHAVSWRHERWLWGVLALHACLAAAAAATTRNDAAQAAIFFFAMAGVYASERLNALAHAHWRAFATQDYFDARGVFAAVLWAGPLLLLLAAMLVGFLLRAARLLVQVKRMQLRRRGRGENAAAAAAPGGAAAPTTRRRAKAA